MMSGIHRLAIVLMGAFLLHAVAGQAGGRTNVSGDFLVEAKKLYAAEMDYFQKRMTSDWQGVYDYHHPLFKENISMAEFKYFQGRVIYNYKQTERQHVSGMRIPSKEYIEKNPGPKDILGFPVPVKFKIFGDPLITIKNLSIGKLAIGKNKRFAKVESKITGRQQLNPAIVHGHIEFPVTIPVVDYWEKVDGRWVITLLKDTTSISGANKFYYIPNNNDGWEQKEFVDIDASLVASDER